MELHSITAELREAAAELRAKAGELEGLARERAEAEQKYSIAMARRVVELKDSGQSVTLIKDIAKGDCADLRFKRDLADGRWTAGKERLESLRAQVSALQTILKYHEEV